MLWVVLGSAAVTIAAGLSIAASVHSRRDIASGHPTFDSIADVTGVWDRSRLDHWLGTRDAADRYTANAEDVHRIPQTLWKRWFDNVRCDVACIGVALASPVLFQSQQAIAVILLSISATYVVVGYCSAIAVVACCTSPLADERPEPQDSPSGGEDVDGE